MIVHSKKYHEVRRLRDLETTLLRISPHHFLVLLPAVLVGKAGVGEVGLGLARAIDGGVGEFRAVAPEGLEERARVAAVGRLRALVAGIEAAHRAVVPEVGAFPKVHHPDDVAADAAAAGFAVPFQEVQRLEALEDPERNADQDTLGVEDPAVELVGRSFARPAG
jgi:hypothetical protein